MRPAERARAGARPRSTAFSIAGAFGDFAPGLPGERGVVGAELGAAERAALRAAIEARGVDFVGQEVVRLSTTPRWEKAGWCRAPSCCASMPPRRRTAGG